MVGTSNESDPGMAIELGNVCVCLCVSCCFFLISGGIMWMSWCWACLYDVCGEL